MKQVLHILKKDLRANWLLILISLLPLTAQLWTVPQIWSSVVVARNGVGHVRSILSDLTFPLELICFIFWTILICRVVQSELLVGDRQFWITRPYHRGSLVTAKIAFIFAAILLPMSIQHGILLAEAGFSPWGLLPELLKNTFAIFIVILLVLFSVAIVTTSLTRMIVSLLGISLLLVLCILFQTVTGYGSNSMPSELTTELVYIKNIVFYGAVLYLQYRHRRTKLAVALLIASFLVEIPLDMLDLQRFVVASHYKPMSAKEVADYQLYGADQVLNKTSSRPSTIFEPAYLELPLHYKNRGSEYAMSVDGLRITMESANGQQWTSTWLVSRDEILLDGNSTLIGESMPAYVYNRFGAHPVKIQVELAISEIKAGDTLIDTLSKSSQERAVPGLGICSGHLSINENRMAYACRAPFNNPSLTLVRSALYKSQSCSDSDRLPREHDAKGWLGDKSYANSAFHLLPISSPDAAISDGEILESDGNLHKEYLCPGAPVTFTPYHQIRRMRTTITINNYDLRAEH